MRQKNSKRLPEYKEPPVFEKQLRLAMQERNDRLAKARVATMNPFSARIGLIGPAKCLECGTERYTVWGVYDHHLRTHSGIPVVALVKQNPLQTYQEETE